MTTTQSKNPLANKAPPVDLNKLHTPYKLAQFVVNVPQLKQDYSFLFNEENKLNSSNNQPSQPFMKGLKLNPNHSHLLNINSINLQSSVLRKTKSKSSKKKRNKKKSKSHHSKLKHQNIPNPNKHLNIDEKNNIEDPYNPINDDVGPSNNILPNSANNPSSKTNIFSNKQKRPRQHDLSPLDTNPRGPITTNPTVTPTLPLDDNNNNNNPITNINAISSPVPLTQMNNDSLQSHHHKSQLSSSSMMSDNNETDITNIQSLPIPSIPEPEPFDDIPNQPTVPVIPSKYDINDTAMMLPSEETFQYQVSMIDTPTIDNIPNQPNIFGLNDVKLNDGPGNIEEQFSHLTSSDEDDIKSIDDFGDDTHSDSDSDTDTGDSGDTDTDTDMDAAEMAEFGFSGMEEEEEKTCIKIGKVLYENSWTGDMISSSTEFSRREYNALLNVGNISIDSYISNLVWKIIFYSQKKTKDDLINEDKIHKKWYWYDCNDIESDWKWRKYNVIICQWISDCYKIYLKDNKNNCINFKKCQEKFEKDHEKNQKKNMRNKPSISDMKDDEKNDEEKINKKKKITIDPYFDKNNNYNHFLVIEKDENDPLNLLIWHKIANKSNDGLEYYREIRLDHKLFDIGLDMIVQNYQPNPSPFAIPPQLAVDT